MKEENINLGGTRAEFKRICTLDVKDMLGWYIDQAVVNTRVEDFLDECTGNVITKEFPELLYRRGTKVDESVQQKLMFYIAEGSLKEPIWLCNQNRFGLVGMYVRAVPYSAKVKIGDKTCKVLLMADGISHAIDVINDYFELSTNAAFFVMALTRMDDCIFVEDKITHMTETDADKAYIDGKISFAKYCELLNDTTKDNHPDEDNRTFWKIVCDMEWQTDTQAGEYEGIKFIVKAVSAEAAVRAVMRRMTERDHQMRDAAERKIDGEKLFTLKMSKVNQLSVSAVIPEKFTIANRKKKDDDRKKKDEDRKKKDEEDVQD